ncbi:MAG: sugar-transfer associated ATP-grasp domain-containing protein [Dongiaceae bacterium]
MPRHHDAVVDNFHAGGIAAAVDLKTGRLGSATDLGNDQAFGWVDAHPANGAPIQGRILPHWQDALALVRAAHGRAFSDRAMLGWDIAITDKGPMIVEGNGGPDLDIIQCVCGIPVGYDRFGELMVEHLLQDRRSIAQLAA